MIALLFVVGFFTAIFMHYGFHRFMGHRPYFKKTFASHAQGHHKSYPRDDYLSKEYRSDNGELTIKHVVPLFCASILICILTLELGMFMLGLSSAAALSVLFHEHYHLIDSPLKRFAFFRELTLSHEVHHVHQDRNMGILTFSLDKLFGTWLP